MEPSPVARTCSTCGHALPPAAEICPQCGRDDANPFVSPSTLPATERPTSWRLVLGFSVILGVGILLGWVAPGVAIAWAVIATPVLVRASAVIQRRHEAGLTVVWEDRFQALMASAGVTLLAGIAASAAFVPACTVGLSLEVFNIGGVGAVALGCAAAAAAGLFTMRRSWPRKITDADHG